MSSLYGRGRSYKKFRNFVLCVMHKYICSKNASFVSMLQVKYGAVFHPVFFFFFIVEVRNRLWPLRVVVLCLLGGSIYTPVMKKYVNMIITTAS